MSETIDKSTKVRSLLFWVMLLLPMYAWAIKTTVIINSGGPDTLRERAGIILTDVLNSCNKHYESKDSFNLIENYFTDSAFLDFKKLVERTELYAIEREYVTNMLLTVDDFYEIRDIKVHVSLGKTKGIPYQFLVFVLDKYGAIVNVHFALEKHQYQDIIEQGYELEDLAYREKIIHFIELYRTAYGKKDLPFIRSTLSDDALIIVGYVVKTEKQRRDYLSTTTLNQQQIQFLRLGKNEYLQRLEKVFQNNDFVRIVFDDIKIIRHPKFAKIYGVQLKQRWNSSTYSDEGYLFLMVDFIQPEEPIIHVRAWQPEKFEDGSTVSIYDFDIVE